MMTISILFPAAALVVGYLLGSVPFAVIVARRHGVDIFKSGSGNPGATNVKRCCGKNAGNLVFFLDMLKGFVAALWPFFVGMILSGTAENDVTVAQLCGFLGAVLGHCFPVFMKFRGGKGVSTTIGGLLGAMPMAVIVGLLVWLVFYYSTKIVAVASIAFGLALPLITMVYAKCWHNYSELEIFFCLCLAFFIIIMHQSNIRRLVAGKENSFKKTEENVPVTEELNKEEKK